MKQATILLDSKPTQSEGDRLAFVFAQEQFKSDNFEWEVSNEVPEYLSVDRADQIEAYRRDLSDSACYLTIKILES